MNQLEMAPEEAAQDQCDYHSGIRATMPSPEMSTIPILWAV